MSKNDVFTSEEGNISNPSFVAKPNAVPYPGDSHTRGGMIELSVEGIDSIIHDINSASDEIESIWNSIKSNDINRIRESWIGPDSDVYIQKILEMDSDIKKALQVQRLLASTFAAAKTEITNTQEDIMIKANRL